LSTIKRSRDEEVAAVFGRARPVIRAALETNYLVPGEDADGLEQSLYEWFSRFSRRPDTQRSVASLRPSLFRMTCKAAQDYWMWRHHGVRVTDDQIRFALNRDPEEIAVELEGKLRKMDQDSQ